VVNGSSTHHWSRSVATLTEIRLLKLRSRELRDSRKWMPRSLAVSSALTSVTRSVRTGLSAPTTIELQMRCVLIPVSSPVVADRDFMDAAFRQLAGKAAEFLAELEEGSDAAIFGQGHRREVHRVAHDSIDEVVAHLQCNFVSDLFLGLNRRGPEVRGRDNVRKADQFGVRIGFFDKHVDCRACQFFRT